MLWEILARTTESNPKYLLITQGTINYMLKSKVEKKAQITKN